MSNSKIPGRQTRSRRGNGKEPQQPSMTESIQDSYVPSEVHEDGDWSDSSEFRQLPNDETDEAAPGRGQKSTSTTPHTMTGPPPYALDNILNNNNSSREAFEQMLNIEADMRARRKSGGHVLSKYVQNLFDIVAESLKAADPAALTSGLLTEEGRVVSVLAGLKTDPRMLSVVTLDGHEVTSTVGQILQGQLWPQGPLPTNWDAIVDRWLYKATLKVKSQAVRAQRQALVIEGEENEQPTTTGRAFSRLWRNLRSEEPETIRR